MRACGAFPVPGVWRASERSEFYFEARCGLRRQLTMEGHRLAFAARCRVADNVLDVAVHVREVGDRANHGAGESQERDEELPHRARENEIVLQSSPHNSAPEASR